MTDDSKLLLDFVHQASWLSSHRTSPWLKPRNPFSFPDRSQLNLIKQNQQKINRIKQANPQFKLKVCTSIAPYFFYVMVEQKREAKTAPVWSDLVVAFLPREGQMFSRIQVLHKPRAISTLFFFLSSSGTISLLCGFSSNIRKRCKI